MLFFLFSSRRRHTRSTRDWSSDVCSSDLEQPGRAGGVRLVEAPPPSPQAPAPGGANATAASAQALEPIGTSHFESTSPMSDAKGSSAMVSILDAKTAGEVVYLYDAESQRG